MHMIGTPELNVEENLDLGQKILAEVPLGVVVTNAHRRIEYVNETFTRETGYNAE